MCRALSPKPRAASADAIGGGGDDFRSFTGGLGGLGFRGRGGGVGEL